MSQELLPKQTDLIDSFGVLQIKLSDRGRRHREFIHIFDKNSRFSKVKDAEILSKKMHKINFDSKNTSVILSATVSLKTQTISVKF